MFTDKICNHNVVILFCLLLRSTYYKGNRPPYTPPPSICCGYICLLYFIQSPVFILLFLLWYIPLSQLPTMKSISQIPPKKSLPVNSSFTVFWDPVLSLDGSTEPLL